MTPEEKAREILDTLPQTDEKIAAEISAAIREAVEAERKACAEVAIDELKALHGDSLYILADPLKASRETAAAIAQAIEERE